MLSTIVLGAVLLTGQTRFYIAGDPVPQGVQNLPVNINMQVKCPIQVIFPVTRPIVTNKIVLRKNGVIQADLTSVSEGAWQDEKDSNGNVVGQRWVGTVPYQWNFAGTDNYSFEFTAFWLLAPGVAQSEMLPSGSFIPY